MINCYPEEVINKLKSRNRPDIKHNLIFCPIFCSIGISIFFVGIYGIISPPYHFMLGKIIFYTFTIINLGAAIFIIGFAEYYFWKKWRI
jgi:hypothetical protein